MTEEYERPIISEPIPLTAEQVSQLAPYFARRGGSYMLLAAVAPTGGSGWALQMHCIPLERRAAIQLACRGELALPKVKRTKAKGAE